MHPNYAEITNQVCAWAQEVKTIRGVVIIGSQARSTILADRWSDLDLMVLVDDVRSFTHDNTWFQRFGEVVCFFDEVVPLHFTSWSWWVKRVLFTSHLDVDFSILPYPMLDEVLSVNKEIISKGYRVIYEDVPGELENKICDLLKDSPQEPARAPSEEELRAVVSELLYHVIWAYKKIKRGEIWVAVGCINCHMRNLLLQLIEAYNLSVNKRSNPLNYSGRFLEQRTDPEILTRLESCFTPYNETDAVQALHHMLPLVEHLAKETCSVNGYHVDPGLFDQVRKMFDEMHGRELTTTGR